MKKIPKEILDSIEPEKREAFKKTYAKKVHLASGGFSFQWSLVTYVVLLSGFFTLFSSFPSILAFFKAELITTSAILSFILLFPVNYLLRSIRSNLNQRGILLIQALVILLGVLFICSSALLRFG